MKNVQTVTYERGLITYLKEKCSAEKAQSKIKKHLNSCRE